MKISPASNGQERMDVHGTFTHFLLVIMSGSEVLDYIIKQECPKKSDQRVTRLVVVGLLGLYIPGMDYIY